MLIQTQTNVGRGRCFIRQALMKKFLVTPVQLLARLEEFTAVRQICLPSLKFLIMHIRIDVCNLFIRDCTITWVLFGT